MLSGRQYRQTIAGHVAELSSCDAMQKKDEVDLDAILSELGQFGRYQIRIYCYILLAIVFSAVYNSQYIFAAGELKYRCQVPECESSPPVFGTNGWGSWALPDTSSKCDRLVPIGGECVATNFLPNETKRCTSWVYESDTTIFAEFDLGCQEWKRTLVGTIHSVGTFTALPITAYVSDTFGRRVALVATAVAPALVGVARAFSNTYWLYIALEFIESTVGSGIYSTGFILGLELVGRDKRVLAGTMISCTFALGQVVAALVAWAFPYWRTYTLIIYSPSVLFIIYYFLIEESVRWLISKGRKKEAASIIFKAADVNKKKLSQETVKILTEESSEVKSRAENAETEKKQSLFIQVVKSKTLMFRLGVCAFWWITLTFVYYGLSINSVSLAGNSYVNYILTSLVEIPGYGLGLLTLDRFGRKYSIMTAFLVCAGALIALPFMPSSAAWAQTALNLLGKLCISMAFSCIYIYTGELFPTQARHSLLGTCSMAGRIGSIVAPQTPLLMAYMESLPYLIFGIMAGTSGLLMLLTPETLRTKLPDTVHQAENIEAVKTQKKTDGNATE